MRRHLVLLLIIVAIAGVIWWYKRTEANVANGGDAPLFQLLQDLKNLGV